MSYEQNDGDKFLISTFIAIIVLAILSLCLFITLFCISCSEEHEVSNHNRSEITYLDAQDVKLEDENFSDEELFEKLDAYEKHFDADSYFVFIDTKYDVIGIYYGYKPLAHFKQTFPKTERLSVTLEELQDYGIELNQEIKNYLQFYAEFPKTTPVMMCYVTL